MTVREVSSLRAALGELGNRVQELGFLLPSPEARDRRRQRDGIARFVDCYLQVRLADPQHPLTLGVFGPTGSGKSTLMNSLAGREISAAGTIRPTTRFAVIWCHPDNAHRYEGRSYDGVAPVIVKEDHPFLRSLTVVDTPDVDSYKEEHKDQAESVLAECDAAIYVTTPQRYADQVPWQILAAVSKRNMPVVILINRLTRRSEGAIADLASMLRSYGIRRRATTRQVIQIQEQHLKDGRIPRAALKPVFSRLQEVVAQQESMRSRTIKGGMSWMLNEVVGLVKELEAQAATGAALVTGLDGAVGELLEEVNDRLTKGTLVRADVVGRWRHEMGVAGTQNEQDLEGETRHSSPKASDYQSVMAEMRRELEEILADRAKRIALMAREIWERDSTGRQVFEAVPWVDEALIRSESAMRVDDWVRELAELVQTASPGKFRANRGSKLGSDAMIALLSTACLSPPLKPAGGRRGTADLLRLALDQAVTPSVSAELISTGKEKLVAAAESVLRTRLKGHLETLNSYLDSPRFVEELKRLHSIATKRVKKYG